MCISPLGPVLTQDPGRTGSCAVNPNVSAPSPPILLATRSWAVITRGSEGSWKGCVRPRNRTKGSRVHVMRMGTRRTDPTPLQYTRRRTGGMGEYQSGLSGGYVYTASGPKKVSQTRHNVAGQHHTLSRLSHTPHLALSGHVIKGESSRNTARGHTHTRTYTAHTQRRPPCPA